MSNILNDNDNKLNLLFKKFQGVSQATINTDGTNGTPFSLEQVSTSNNVFQKEIFAEDVPIDLSLSIQCGTLHDNSGIPDSTWNNNVYDQSLSFVDLSMNGKPLPLRFYKNVYLNQTIVNQPQVWWLLNDSLATPRPENNVLKNMIPFSYNINTKDVYSPIVS